MTKPVQCLAVPQQQPVAAVGICMRLKYLAEAILQIAVRILFVVASILLATKLFSPAVHIVALPLAGLSATLFAAFFFPQPNRISAPPYFDSPSPLIRLLPPTEPGQMPANMPLGAPRGLPNVVENHCAQNCGFNSLAQFLLSDPQLVQWLRSSLPQNIGMDAFKQFLADYNPPPQLLAGFTKHFEGHPHPRPPIPGMFNDFLQLYRPCVEEIRASQTFKETCEHILILQNIGMDAFKQFLADYNPPPQLLAEFTKHFEGHPHPRSPIPRMFNDFLQLYRPCVEEIRASQTFKEIYEHILILQEAYGSFFDSYENAVERNLAVISANAQTLREAAHKLNVRIPSSWEKQTDPSEPMQAILDVLPNNQKMTIQTAYTLKEVSGVASPRKKHLSPKEESVGSFTLEFADDNPAPKLEEMLKKYMDHGNEPPYLMEDCKAEAEGGGTNNYPLERCRVCFQKPPSALRLHIKRFTAEQRELPSSEPENLPPKRSWMECLFPFWYPPAPRSRRPSEWHGIKKSTPIECPEELEIPLTNGEKRRYRLSGFIEHSGELLDRGHYIAGRIVDGQRYIMSDESVTLVRPEVFDQHARNAYFLGYLPAE